MLKFQFERYFWLYNICWGVTPTNIIQLFLCKKIAIIRKSSNTKNNIISKEVHTCADINVSIKSVKMLMIFIKHNKILKNQNKDEF